MCWYASISLVIVSVHQQNVSLKTSDWKKKSNVHIQAFRMKPHIDSAHPLTFARTPPGDRTSLCFSRWLIKCPTGKKKTIDLWDPVTFLFQRQHQTNHSNFKWSDLHSTSINNTQYLLWTPRMRSINAGDTVTFPNRKMLASRLFSHPAANWCHLIFLFQPVFVSCFVCLARQQKTNYTR